MTENKTVYYTPDPATILKLYTEMENGKYENRFINPNRVQNS